MRAALGLGWTVIFAVGLPAGALAQAADPAAAGRSDTPGSIEARSPVEGSGAVDDLQAGTPPPVRESEMSDARARAHFRAGQSLYEAGSFERAAAEFMLAFELSTRPELLYNVFLAYRDGGMLEQAATSLRRYVDSLPPTAEGRLNLVARLEALERTVAANRAREAEREQRAAEAAQSPAALPPVSPPLPAEPAPRRASTAPPRPPPDDGLPVGVLVLSGVSVASFSAAIATGLLALAAESELETKCPSNVCPPFVDLEDERNDPKKLAFASDVLLGVGVVSAGAAVAWWLLSSDGAQERSGLAATALCVPDTCAASLRGRF